MRNLGIAIICREGRKKPAADLEFKAEAEAEAEAQVRYCEAGLERIET